MFTVQDLTVGDLVASMQLTVTSIKNLPAKVHGIQLMSVNGIGWDDNQSHSITVLANKEIEVWE
jgi:hypothetical protein